MENSLESRFRVLLGKIEQRPKVVAQYAEDTPRNSNQGTHLSK